MTEKVDKGDCLKEICDQLAECKLTDPQSTLVNCLMESILSKDVDLSEAQKLYMKDALLKCLIEKLCVEVKAIQDSGLNQGLTNALATILSGFRVVEEILHEMKGIIVDAQKGKK
jgi:hypothetical protein